MLLSVEECRKILKDHESSDKRIEELRDALYAVSNSVLDDYLKEIDEKTN